MAKKRRKTRKKKASPSRRKPQDNSVSPIVAMAFGLAVGLSVAVAIYVKDRRPDADTPVTLPEPASMQGSIDNNGEAAADEVAPEPEEKARERRFTFYEDLVNFELHTPDVEPTVSRDSAPQAIVEPGVYVLQAGSFSTDEDADRRRAELGMHGIESRVQRVTINDRNYYRVLIGPTDDLDELNLLRSRLRVAKIDVFRIRLSD